MRLDELRDFGALITNTHYWLRESGRTIPEQLVEKDYYITEVLRIAALRLGNKAIFKGGTSLSKGWNLIQRFSEDVDLFVNAGRFDPPLTEEDAIREELRALRDEVRQHPALRWLKDESRTRGPEAREDRFGYTPLLEADARIQSKVILEAGTRSGDFPTVEMPMNSYIGEHLQAIGKTDIADNADPFTMMLLHFRRTFVEKVFTIHCSVEALLDKNKDLDRAGRHYYDLYYLLKTDDVRTMLKLPEFQEIKKDCWRITEANFPTPYLPADLRFNDSRALFPSRELSARLSPQYDSDCRKLCYGEDIPRFDEVQGAFEEIRELL